LRCSHVAAYYWIKSYGVAIEGIRSSAGVKVVEMDEMHTYVGSKKLLLDLDCC
jgi:transposase